MACLFLILVVICIPQESPAPDADFSFDVPRLRQCADRLDAFFPMWLQENIVPRGLDRVWPRESLNAFRELIVVSCQADAAGINECLAALPKSDPRFHVAILIVLFEQRDRQIEGGNRSTGAAIQGAGSPGNALPRFKRGPWRQRSMETRHDEVDGYRDRNRFVEESGSGDSMGTGLDSKPNQLALSRSCVCPVKESRRCDVGSAIGGSDA